MVSFFFWCQKNSSEKTFVLGKKVFDLCHVAAPGPASAPGPGHVAVPTNVGCLKKLPGELLVCFFIVKTSRVLPLNTFWMFGAFPSIFRVKILKNPVECGQIIATSQDQKPKNVAKVSGNGTPYFRRISGW